MIEKIRSKKQMQRLLDLRGKYKIPEKVVKKVEDLIEILDTEYGNERDVDNDDGGYVLLMLPESDKDDMQILHRRLLKEYHLRYGTAEFESAICRYDGLEWCMELYLATNDYGITVVYPK